MIRTVNLAKPKSRGVEGHSPVKYEDIVKNLKGGMSMEEQCEKVHFVRMHGKTVFERAIKHKVGQVYTLSSIVERFKRLNGSYPDSIDEIKVQVERSRAFDRIDTARIILPLLISEE